MFSRYLLPKTLIYRQFLGVQDAMYHKKEHILESV